jgi:ATP-dependent Clp protease protease subunit
MNLLKIKSNKNGEAEVKVYHGIGPWERLNAERLGELLDEAKSQGYRTLRIRMHSPGGSIFEGMAMITVIQQHEVEVIAQVDGIAASMASAVLAASNKAYMAEGTRVMIHQGAGGVMGSAQQIKNYGELLESLNASIADLYSSKTGKDSKWILENWMPEGKDTWLTDKEALAAGLIDGILPGIASEPKDTNFKQMVAHYDGALNKNPMEKLIAELNKKGAELPADATEEQIADAIAKIEVKEKEQKNADHASTQAKDQQGKLVASLTRLAEAKGLKDEKLEKFKKIAERDSEAALDMLDMIETPAAEAEKPKTLSEILEGYKAANGGTAATDERKGWTLREWEQKDPDGLTAMVKTKPDSFKALFKAQYGIEPDEDYIKKIAS